MSARRSRRRTKPVPEPPARPASEPIPERQPLAVGPLVIAGLTLVVMLASFDPTGSYPWSADGPGLTIDETFNASEGYVVWARMRHVGLGLLDPTIWPEIYDGTTPDHPPLGRLWLGISEWAFSSVFSPAEPRPKFASIAAARTGSIVLFAITVWLVGCTAQDWCGPVAGWAASLALVLMPRTLGHGYIASLETAMNLTWLMTLLVFCRFPVDEPPTNRTIIGAGIVFGLAFLTKIQAVLVVPVLAVWLVWRYRTGAVRVLALGAGVTFATFFLGWPHLWTDPVTHTFDYFARATDRLTLYCTYFGTRYADVDVPWHYPWMLTLSTVPLTTLLLAGFGVKPRAATDTGQHQSHAALLLGSIVLPLVVFSLPGVAVYDGMRLFLVICPPLAILAGCGAARLVDRFPTRVSVVALALCVALQFGHTLTVAPAYLSGYSLTTGGLFGASALGHERDYWSNSLTRSLLRATAETVPKGSVVAIAPVLHQFQCEALLSQSPPLRSQRVTLVPWSARKSDGESEPRFLLIYRRRADLPTEVVQRTRGRTPVASVTRQGVQLSALYDLQSPPDR